MRLLAIDNLKDNMQVAKNIYSADGNILLAEGVNLTTYSISRLKELGITSIYIYDNRIGKVEIDDLVKTQTKNEITKITKEAMTNIRDGRNMSGERIQKIIGDVMDELLLNRNISFNLIDIRTLNDYNFSHNVTVCVLSLMTGITLNFSPSKLKQLGTGAILHDIGKLKIPETILNKNDYLTDEEFMEVRKHPQIGYEMLLNYSDVGMIPASVAWQHHERYDGSGYPRGLKGNEISEFARIVAMADVYDALSTDRIYRKRLLAHEVIEYIRDKGKEFFDPDLTDAFLNNIAPFPIGSIVILSNGERGVVIRVTKNFPARPTVKVFTDSNGHLLKNPVERDLETDLTLFIIRAVKDEENLN